MKPFFVFIVILIISFTIITPVLAAEEVGEGEKTLNQTSNPTLLTNPLGDIKHPSDLIGRIINAALGIVGSLALLMFVVGGLTWMTSSGNTEKIEKGKQILVWASIGLLVVFASYALVRFVITSFATGV